jgi:hypothetical protein
MEPKLVDVFDHTAQSEVVEKLRSVVIHDIHWMCNTYRDVERVTVAELDPDVYKALKEKYRQLLHFGNFGLPKPRTLANELIWKWTEATGKYVGCQFWSANAKKLFDREVESVGGWPITEKLARAIEKRLSAKSIDGKARPSNGKLTHEHVYPIKDLKKFLRANDQLSLNDIRELFDRQCVSCIVLESEHDRLRGDDLNPWVRYAKAEIMLADNPTWAETQRKAIADAYREHSSNAARR